MREAFGYASIEWKKGIDWDAVRALVAWLGPDSGVGA